MDNFWLFFSATAIHFKYLYALFGFGNATAWEDIDSKGNRRIGLSAIDIK